MKYPMDWKVWKEMPMGSTTSGNTIVFKEIMCPKKLIVSPMTPRYWKYTSRPTLQARPRTNTAVFAFGRSRHFSISRAPV